ncbi:hypothetical protein HT136_04440 [Novosphingobium profundi]|uniref:hypothetical protein n=1 Tax=Novosphingobium profundi TaxID=1774954 RepID=UPI001BDAE0FC|nr:hypothetical protein [Novosphingobium profundi]MBT0667613.1 hypothetical protein [Novosphingobium profundi]
MAETPEPRHEPRYEGWHVTSPGKVALLAIAVPLVLFVLIFAAGSWFKVQFGPETFREPHAFPAPGLAFGLPRPSPAADAGKVPPPHADPQIEQAKDRIVREGIVGWEGLKR